MLSDFLKKERKEGRRREYLPLISAENFNKLILKLEMNVNVDNMMMYVTSSQCTYRVPSKGSWAPSRDYGS